MVKYFKKVQYMMLVYIHAIEVHYTHYLKLIPTMYFETLHGEISCVISNFVEHQICGAFLWNFASLDKSVSRLRFSKIKQFHKKESH